MSIQNSYQLFHDQLQFHKIYEKISRPLIVSDDIRTPENMGAILRLAGNIGALQSLFISDRAHTFKHHKISKTASGAADKTDWKIIQPNELLTNIPNDYSLIALETTSDAQNIFQFKLPEKVAFVTGNEVNGIRPEIIQHTINKVYIPIPGPISSLNVTHALSIALFEWYRQISLNI